MNGEQRQFLLTDFRELIGDLELDTREDGMLGPETVRLIGCLKPTIAWLAGEKKPEPIVKAFFEERLRAFYETTNYRELAPEHDALAAALKELQ